MKSPLNPGNGLALGYPDQSQLAGSASNQQAQSVRENTALAMHLSFLRHLQEIRQHMFDDEEDNDYNGATETEVIESLQEEVAELKSQVKWLRTNVGTLRRWIALARCGDLNPEAAFQQLEIDIDRIAGPQVPQSCERSDKP
jgi:hypothetical protein